VNPVRRLNLSVARSYGPLLAVAMVFLLMATVVPTADREHQAYAGNVEVPNFENGQAAAPGETGGTDGAGAGGTGGTGGGGTGGGGGGAQGGVSPCTDRTLQVPGDPYSPPCYAFSGDNGGSTYKGVSSKEILVTVRTLEGPSAAEIFADISGEQVSDSPDAYRNTANALAEYFSTRFQMYGRKIKLVEFRGQGNGATELLGGGKEKALADAVRASKEHKAFADISAITIPYADALAQQKMVNIGSPYPSREWFVNRRPYSWSLFPDGTNVVESSAAAFDARLPPGSSAQYAGPSLKGKKRVYGIVAPENQEYQESVQAFIRRAEAAGIPITKNMKYKLDLSSMPNQASNIIAQLKDAGITSVLCACDPVMLALGMTPKANEQGYEPEWITSGLAFVDQDIVSQLIDQDQWSHAFGIAYNAESEPQGRSFPYAAFKQMRPNDEPAFGVEEIYYQMYLLAIGIQMAGPNLTPQTFEAGMFAYPGGSGPRGLWGFGQGDYTPTDDFREIWWDPNRISGQNNKKGAWVQLNGGARWSPRRPPTGPAGYFKEG
jgi:Periplasmic binding protein